ncbi:MAG: hypothetical protein ABI811_16040 [Acidobacteriota bacterium]
MKSTTQKSLLSLVVALTAAVVMFLAPTPGSGQDAPAKGGPPGGKGGVAPGGAKAGGGKGAVKGGAFGPDGPYYQAPENIGGPPARTPDGKPDMTGYWTPRMNRAIFEIQGKQGAIVDPPDGMLPYTPAALAKKNDLKKNHMFDETEAHCFQSGVPHSAYQQFGYQIQQTPSFVVLMPEYAHSYRVVPTDGRKHIPADVKLFMGDPVGHWEGDTLVVETTNQNGKVWLDMEANFTTNAIHVVERFTMVDKNQINYEAIITDPTIYTRPWKIAGNLGRHDDPNYELMEFACHEGNIDLQHYPESEGGTAKAKAK